MAKKTITEEERLVEEQMFAMLEWASDHSTKWLSIGKLDATKKAAALLAKRGVIELWPETNGYGLKPKKSTFAPDIRVPSTKRDVNAHQPDEL